MQEAGAGWLMTLLSSDPLMVALVQAASTAPMFLLALPSGALSDIVDRRRYLLVLQGWMAGVALTLALLTWSGGITPAGLLGLTCYENMSERALSSEPVNIETCHPLIEAILMTW